MKKSQYILDTNFILRYLLEDHEAQHKKTVEFFDNVQAGTAKTILKETVFTEVIFMLSSYYEVPRNIISKVLSNFLLYKGVVIDGKDILLEALNIYQNTKLHIIDTILAAEHFLNQHEVMTFDRELKRYIRI